MKSKIIAALLGFLSLTSLSATPLEGTWKSGCYPEGSGYYAIVTLTFSGDQVTTLGRAYRDDKCWDNAGHGTDKSAYSLGAAFGEGTAIDLVDAKGRKAFAIFKIEGSTLYLSDTATKAAERPTSVDRDVGYELQTLSAPTDQPQR